MFDSGNLLDNLKGIKDRLELVRSQAVMSERTDAELQIIRDDLQSCINDMLEGT